MPLLGPDLATPDAGEQYATVLQAREAGAGGDDATVLGALAAARTRIDRFTGTIFDVRERTITVEPGDDGLVQLETPLLAITSVRYVGPGILAGVLVDPATYALSTDSAGQPTRLRLGLFPYAGLDTILGRERWSERRSEQVYTQAEVTGTFGRQQVPFEVMRATVLLAAAIANVGGPSDPGSVNVEGDADAPPRVGNVTTLGTGSSLTTGLAEADLLLEPYRTRVRIS